MKTKCWHILTVLALLAPWGLHGTLADEEPAARNPPRTRGQWRRNLPNGKNDTAIRAAFQEALEGASAATARVLADGDEVALAAVVDPDGYLVSKASVLSGKLVCRFKDGTRKEAQIVGKDESHDLALLRVEATDLPTVTWRDGPLPMPGSFVATAAPANQPVAIGVVSTELRKVFGPATPPSPRAWLGIELAAGSPGLAIASVVPGSPAARARIRVGDEVKQIDDAAMESADQIVHTVGGHAIGQTVKLLVHRKDENVEIVVKLARARAPQDEWGGGPFSDRRSGFPEVLPHDTPLNPKDCGGPLVDTDGRVVGINIARALRVTTYALPASVVRDVVSELKQKAKGETHDR